MTVTIEQTESERICGYSECRRPLNYHGLGRPPEYCTNRRWPEEDPAGKTCKQMAAQERTAQRAVGLDLLLTSYHASTATLVPVAETLLERLTDLLAKTADLGEGALAAVTTAEGAAVTAVERASAAEADAVAARRAETTATAARDRAIADQTAATNAAREARAAADEQVRAALADIADAQRARGIAEADAAAATRAATEAQHGHATASAEAHALRSALQDSHEQNTVARHTIDDLTRRADLADATTAHLRELLTAAGAANTAHEQRITAITEQHQQAESRIRELEHVIEHLRVEAASAQADAIAATSSAAAANQRAEQAEAASRMTHERYDALVSRLVDASAHTSALPTPA
ncbi:MAG TPA: hypothetical protein VL118_04440 [Luteimonas sp.]|nr:hypothetical protein [Luteimonas sp.]